MKSQIWEAVAGYFGGSYKRITVEEWENLMATVADVQARLATLQAEVTEQKTVINGTKALLNGLSAMIASLRQELQDAIASGGSDPVALQAVVDGLDAITSELDAATADLAAATLANTPAQE